MDELEQAAKAARDLAGDTSGEEAPRGADPEQAAGNDPGAPSGAPGEPSQTEVIAALLSATRKLPWIAPRFPSAVAVLDDDTILQAAHTAGEVLAKYELNALAWLDRWRPEMMMAYVWGSLLIRLSEAIAADLEAARARAAAPVGPAAAGPAPAAPGGPVETPRDVPTAQVIG